MRVPLIVFCLWLLPGAAVALLQGVTLVVQKWELLWPLFVGLAVGAVISPMVLFSCPEFKAFVHERCHFIMALPLAAGLPRIAIGSDGQGQVQFAGGIRAWLGDHLIGLAPYYLPPVTFSSIVATFFVPPEHMAKCHGWIGFSLAFHITSVLIEVAQGWNKRFFSSTFDDEQMIQSDIGQSGYVLSGLLIVSCNFVLVGLMLHMLAVPGQAWSEWSDLTGRTSGVAWSWAWDRAVNAMEWLRETWGGAAKQSEEVQGIWTCGAQVEE